MDSPSLVRGLAALSLGLGFAELFAPRPLARFIGVDEGYDRRLRLVGLRELLSGLGLVRGNTAGCMWSRVGGDIMDLALLGAALRSQRSNPRRVVGTMAAIAGVGAIDVLATIQASRPGSPPNRRTRAGRGSNQEYETPPATTEIRETAAVHEFEPGD